MNNEVSFFSLSKLISYKLKIYLLVNLKVVTALYSLESMYTCTE